MSTIPTVEDFLNTITSMDHPDHQGLSYKDTRDLMVRFAKLHVEEALKAASENASVKYEKGSVLNPDGDWILDHDSILNSYPLDNIK